MPAPVSPPPAARRPPPAARRQVAVKVLRPELAATLGPDLFIREIAAGPWP